MRCIKGMSQSSIVFAGLLAGAAFLVPAQAAPTSSPYRLATYSDLSTAAVNDDGTYVVATSVPVNPASNGPPYAVEVQRFDRRGVPLAAAIRVATPSGSQSLDPTTVVASDGRGNFAVAWQRLGSLSGSLRVQRFDVAGNRIGDEIEVSRDKTPSFAIAMNRGGSFAVGWTSSAGVRLTYPTVSAFDQLVIGADSFFLTLSNTVHVRQFDAFGRPLGNELQVVETAAESNRAAPSSTRQPSQVQFLELRLNLDDLGNGLAIWERDPTRSGNASLPRTTLVQRFDPLGATRGQRFATDLGLGRVGFDAAGNAVSVVPTADGIAGRRLAAGATTTKDFPIAHRITIDGVTLTPGTPAISVSRGGSFVVAWSALREAVPPGQSFPERIGSDIVIQRFDASAIALGTPVPVSGALPESAAQPFAASPTVAFTGRSGSSILTNWFQSSEPLDNRGITYAAVCCTTP